MDEKDRTLENYGAIDGTEIFADVESAWNFKLFFYFYHKKFTIDMARVLVDFYASPGEAFTRTRKNHLEITEKELKTLPKVPYKNKGQIVKCSNCLQIVMTSVMKETGLGSYVSCI